MNDPSGAGGGGLFAALKRIAALLLSSGRTRLELFANELEEEKLRLFRLLLLAWALAFSLGVAVLTGVLFLTALFWESRLWVLGFSCAVFAACAFFSLRCFRQSWQRPETMFAASLAELQEDLRQLKAAVAHESPAE